jgi:hypothetical protein
MVGFSGDFAGSGKERKGKSDRSATTTSPPATPVAVKIAQRFRGLLIAADFKMIGLIIFPIFDRS